MTIDIDNYRNKEAMQTITGSAKYDSESWLNKTGLIPLLARLFLSAFRWYFWKYAFYVTLMAIGVSVMNSEKIADHLASDGYFAAWGIFAEDQEFRSSLTNSHPVYESEFAWKIGQEANIDLKEKFWYYKIQELELLVMRDVVRQKCRNCSDDGTPLKLRHSTYFTMDAEDYCANLSGFVPTREILEQAVSKLHIKRYDGVEMTDGDVGIPQAFRCVIPISLLMAEEE